MPGDGPIAGPLVGPLVDLFDAALQDAVQNLPARGMGPLTELLLARLARGLSPEEQPSLSGLAAAETACQQFLTHVNLSDSSPPEHLHVAGLAFLARAAVLRLCRQSAALQEAERSLLHAHALWARLAGFDVSTLRIQTYLMQAELMADVASQVKAVDRDGFIDRALVLAQAAQYLLDCGPRPDKRPADRAHVLAAQALLEAQRFGSARDHHLMNALDLGAQALAVSGLSNAIPQQTAVRWPVLLLRLGNAALAIAVQRSRFVPYARQCFEHALQATDAARYPGLAASLKLNLGMWASEGGEAALLAGLPAAEQRARQETRNKGDATQ